MVVTRAAAQADALADLVRATGADVVVVPLTEVVAVPEEAARLAACDPATFDWLVVTSPNGAAHCLAALPVAPAHVAAVGAATASALVNGGVPVTLVPATQSAEGLLAEFPAPPTDGAGRPPAVLLVQGAEAQPAMAEGLAARGWSVTVVAPYRTAPVTPADALVAAARSADAVLFASGSAARAWVTVFGAVAPPVVVAIGPQTASAATAAGLKISSVATDHSLQGLVQELLSVFAAPR